MSFPKPEFGSSQGATVLQGLINILQAGFALQCGFHPFQDCHCNRSRGDTSIIYTCCNFEVKQIWLSCQLASLLDQLYRSHIIKTYLYRRCHFLAQCSLKKVAQRTACLTSNLSQMQPRQPTNCHVLGYCGVQFLPLQRTSNVIFKYFSMIIIPFFISHATNIAICIVSTG